MARRRGATCELETGTTFPVELANISERSFFMMTVQPLSFRDRVTLTVEGLTLVGEVAYVAQEDPRGAVIVFEPEAEVRERLSIWMEDSEVLLSTEPEELWSDATEPQPESLTDSETGIDPTLLRAAELDAADPIAADRDPADPDTNVHPAIEEPTDEHDSEHLAFADNSETAPQVEASPRLPELASDGTLHFETADDFRAQYQTDIINGGLIVRSSPLPIGSQKMIKVDVPGGAKQISVSARVGFVGSGTVGLMIDSFPKHKHHFEELFQSLAGR